MPQSYRHLTSSVLEGFIISSFFTRGTAKKLILFFSLAAIIVCNYLLVLDNHEDHSAVLKIGLRLRRHHHRSSVVPRRRRLVLDPSSSSTASVDTNKKETGDKHPKRRLTFVKSCKKKCRKRKKNLKKCKNKCTKKETTTASPEPLGSKDYGPPLFPLSSDKLDLLERSAYLSDIVFYKDKAEKEVGMDSYFQYPKDSGSTDAALISEDDDGDRGLCIVAFRGTKPNANDWCQNLNLEIEKYYHGDNNKQYCWARKGFVEAFAGPNRKATNGDDDEEHYAPQLLRRIEQCISRGMQLVFTGHSQGGSIADIAHLTYASEKPLSVTFGQPPTFVARNGEADPCPYIDSNRIYRFLNTEKDQFQMDYDFIPFIRRVADALVNVIQIFGPILPKGSVQCLEGLVETAQKQGSTIGTLVGKHKGDAILFAPKGGSNVKLYKQQEKIPKPTLFQLDVIDVDDISKIKFDGTATAHDMATYLGKVRQLKDAGPSGIKTNGFAAGRQCNYDVECQSENCISWKKRCSSDSRRPNGEKCQAGGDCQSLRCEGGIFTGTCQSRLPAGSSCNENSDCNSWRCEGYLLNKECQNKLSAGSSCNEHEDCSSNMCLGYIGCSLTNSCTCIAD